MNRRAFMGAAGVAAVASLGAGARAASPEPSSRAAPSTIDRKDLKAWAREHYQGVGNLLLPSFMPDLRTLDEDGVRLDVRQSIAHGFTSSSCAELGLDVATTTELLRIACDEARGRLQVGAILEYETLEENLDLLRRAEAVGCSHAFLVFPASLQPRTEADVLAYYRPLIEATTLGIILYASPSARMLRFDPSGIPFAVFDQLAREPSVVALKLTQTINPVLAFECCQRYAGRLAVNCVHLDLLPLLSRSFNVHWSGDWIAEAVQSPDRRFAVDYVDALRLGDTERALTLYWQLQPAYEAVFALQAPLLRRGGHPWQHMKYFQFAVGGNGGLIAARGQTLDQVGTLTEAGRQTIRETYRRIGVSPVDLPDGAFITGVANHDKGVDPATYTRRPFYA